MTVVIIDLFEKIDIKKEDGAFISSVSCHMLGKLRMKGLSVYKTGQLKKTDAVTVTVLKALNNSPSPEIISDGLHRI